MLNSAIQWLVVCPFRNLTQLHTLGVNHGAGFMACRHPNQGQGQSQKGSCFRGTDQRRHSSCGHHGPQGKCYGGTVGHWISLPLSPSPNVNERYSNFFSYKKKLLKLVSNRKTLFLSNPYFTKQVDWGNYNSQLVSNWNLGIRRYT